MRSYGLKGIKCYKDDFFLVIAFYLSLFNFLTIPFANILRDVLVIILLLYIVQNIRRIIQSRNKTIYFLVVLYAAWMVIDAFFYNEYIYLANVNSPFHALIKSAIIIETIFIVDIYCKKRGFSRLLDILFKYIGIMFVISNAWLMISGFETTSGDYYLVGTKFSTSYLSILFIALLIFKYCYYRKRIRYVGLILLYIACFYLIFRIECTSALIALLLLAIFLIFKKPLHKLFANRWLFLAFYVAIFLFVYFYNYVLNNVYIAHFIVNVLGESLTMTGRTHVYQILPDMIPGKWLTGFGSGRTGMILNHYTGCNDAQNGVWQIICENGLLGFIFYALTSLKIYVNGSKEQVSNSYYLNVYFVIMLILGFVEITIDTRLLVLMFIMYLYNINAQETTESINRQLNYQG